MPELLAPPVDEHERLRDAFRALVGEELEATVLFVDVRDFTALAEHLRPRDLVARLNRVYEHVVPIVLAHGGHINRFTGDGLLAVFGAPEPHDDHADRAVAAALEIAGAIRDDLGGALRVGLGVNSGSVLVATVGGGGRLDLTVIGDPVNTAARVEAATRRTGDDVLITAATHGRLRRDHGRWSRRAAMPLRGKARPVELYAPAA